MAFHSRIVKHLALKLNALVVEALGASPFPAIEALSESVRDFLRLGHLRLLLLLLIDEPPGLLLSANVLNELSHVDVNTVIHASTSFDILGEGKPVGKRKVNGLGDVETEIEPRMVARTASDHELARPVEGLCHAYPLLREHFGVDHYRLVSNELLALSRLLWELRGNEVLEVFIAVCVDTVPKLGGTVVKVVDGIEIHVLLMPAKHRLPRTDVNVRSVHTWDSLIGQAFPKKLG